MLTRSRLAIVVLMSCITLLGTGPRVGAQEDGPAFFLNSTLDLPYEPAHCLPGQICTFRAAIEKAVSFGVGVRVCFDENCPLGAQPMSVEDPGYDAATGRWTVTFGDSFQPFVIDGSGLDVDLSKYVAGWSNPGDNRIVLYNSLSYNQMFMVEGAEITLAGFDIMGSFEDAAIVARRQATRNQFGPGLNLVAFEQGNGIRLLDAGTTHNRIVGNWCGLRVNKEGEVVEAGLREDCVHIARGASDNFVGGPDPEDRNVFSASTLGFAISLHDPATRNNTIQGNLIGTDPTGTKSMGNESGIAIFNEAIGTHILDNVISGNRNHGLFLSNASTDLGRNTTLIENNIIGADYSGRRPLPNKGYGVNITGLSKRTHLEKNQIWFNGTGGVVVCGELTRYNTITQNSITDNAGNAIHVCEGASEGVLPPVIEDCSSAYVEGTACPDCLVEVFSDPGEEAAVFEGDAKAGKDGRFTLRKPEGFAYDNLTSTATENKNTSGLSSPCFPGTYPTLTPTPRPGETAVPTSTPYVKPISWVFLPWTGNSAE